MDTSSKQEPRKPGADLTLRTWRTRMGYSLDDAAMQLGCPRSRLEKWERANRPPPRYIGLACAALALGMSPYKD